MKKNLKALMISMLVVAAAVTATSCNKDDDAAEVDTISIPSGYTELKGNVTSSRTLDGKYYLTAPVKVKSGATLTIEAGTEIMAMKGEDPIYILVEQGAKIDAEGTADNLIRMTVEGGANGAKWGGLHLCGKAQINNYSASGNYSEIGTALYGADNDTNNDDSSGKLKYIVLEYTGDSLDADHESNGVSFYGVGSGTEVSYLCAYQGYDDGFEFFGGSVNVSHLIAINCKDDSFDWTDGWVGSAQFLVAYQNEETAKVPCDCLMECDTRSSDEDKTPASNPTIANVTLIGDTFDSTKNDGIMLKAGTKIQLYNAIVTGKTDAIEVRTKATDDSLTGSGSIINYVSIYGGSINTGNTTDEYGNVTYTPTYSESTFKGQTGNAVLADAPSFSSKFVGTLESDYDSSTLGTVNDYAFASAQYRGAVQSGSDWTEELVAGLDF